jgi:hypothetical protein
MRDPDLAWPEIDSDPVSADTPAAPTGFYPDARPHDLTAETTRFPAVVDSAETAEIPAVAPGRIDPALVVNGAGSHGK